MFGGYSQLIVALDGQSEFSALKEGLMLDRVCENAANIIASSYKKFL